MLDVQIIQKTKALDSILAAINKLDDQYIEIGYFSSQGKHKGKDGIADMTYPALAQALELGLMPEQLYIPLPFMRRIGFETIEKAQTSPKIKKAWKAWRVNLVRKSSPKLLLNAYGEFAQEQAQRIMGDPRYFPQTKHTSPVVETGELRSKFTYRSSFDNSVRKT